MCCGIPAATSWLTTGTTRERSSTTSGTAQSRPPCATQRWRRIGSRAFGKIEPVGCRAWRKIDADPERAILADLRRKDRPGVRVIAAAHGVAINCAAHRARTVRSRRRCPASGSPLRGQHIDASGAPRNLGPHTRSIDALQDTPATLNIAPEWDYL